MNAANATPFLALPIGLGLGLGLGKSEQKESRQPSPKTPTRGSKKAARIEREEAGEEKCADSTFTVSADFFDLVLDCSERRDPLGILRWINQRIADKIGDSISWIPSGLRSHVQSISGLKFTRAHFDAACKEPNSFLLFLTSNRGDQWEPIHVTIKKSKGVGLVIHFKTEPITETWAPWKKLQKLLINEYTGDGILLKYTNIRNMQRQVRPN